jgi:Protein of unknown function (DUF3017)
MPPDEPGRRLDPLAAVVLIVAVGVGIAALHHARIGMLVVCVGVGLGAVLRLVLSPTRAGMLVVRNRRVDVAVLGGMALAIGILAAVTPFPHGQG